MSLLHVDPSFAQDDEEDSAYGEKLNSSLTSLASEATKFRYVKGRRYHSYQAGRYVFPNDDEENDRLDMVHQMIYLALGRETIIAPIQNPKRILDIGTGTGIWAMDAGDRFPAAEVIGNDLSPTQPRWVPPNVTFEVDDVEQPWTYAQTFDLIHCRGLYGSIRDWPGLLDKCFAFTSPGGYCQLVDWDNRLTSPDDSIPKNSALKQFNEIIVDALEAKGTTAHPGLSLTKWARDAGYKIERSFKVALPFGQWPADRRLKEIGTWNFAQFDDGLEGFATYTLCENSNWTKEEVGAFCARVRTELKNKGIHSMLWLYVVVGKKEGEDERAGAEEAKV